MNKLLIPLSAVTLLSACVVFPLSTMPEVEPKPVVAIAAPEPAKYTPVTVPASIAMSFDMEMVTSIQKAPEPEPEPEPEDKSPEEVTAILAGNEKLPEEKDGQKLTGPRETEILTLGRTIHEKEQGGTVIDIAAKYLGASYVWGGVSPTDGWDCSGYVQYVFREAGIPLPRVEQWVGQQKIKREDALPGDLIVQDGGSHVGIYAGNGMMYSALNPSQGTMLHAVDILPAEFYRISVSG